MYLKKNKKQPRGAPLRVQSAHRQSLGSFTAAHRALCSSVVYFLSLAPFSLLCGSVHCAADVNFPGVVLRAVATSETGLVGCAHHVPMLPALAKAQGGFRWARLLPFSFPPFNVHLWLGFVQVRVVFVHKAAMHDNLSHTVFLALL